MISPYLANYQRVNREANIEWSKNPEYAVMQEMKRRRHADPPLWTRIKVAIRDTWTGMWP